MLINSNDINIRKSQCILWIKNNMPFLLLYLLMLLAHSRVYADFRDDSVNKQILSAGSDIFSILSQLRNVQSSRTIVDGSLLTVLSLPIGVFRVLNASAYTVCAIAIKKIFGCGEKKDSWISIALVLIFPACQMFACGWVTTSVVYLWTLATLLLSFTWYSYIIKNKSVPVYIYIFLVFSTIYATNHEQCAALMMGFSVIMVIYLYLTRKKVYWFAIIQMVISGIMLILASLSTGNLMRTQAQVIANMPDYYHKSLFQRAFELSTYTSSEYLYGSNSAVILLCGLCCLVVWKKYKDVLLRFIATVPLCVVLAYGPFQQISSNIFPGLFNNGSFGCYNIFQISNYVQPFLSISTWGCMAISIYMSLCENKNRALFAVIALFGGLMSRMILIITPSYLASGYRTSVFLYFLILIIDMMILQYMYGEGKKYRIDIVNVLVAILSFMSYVSFCASI